MSSGIGKRSDAKHLAKCVEKTYYYCRAYGHLCGYCEFGINIKREKSLLKIIEKSESEATNE